MTEVSPTLTSRWRSRKHVGSAKPSLKVEIQRGRMDHRYATYVHLGGRRPRNFGSISGSVHNARPWHAFWNPGTDWLTVPQISSVGLEASMSGGVAEPTVATIVLENILESTLTGVAGQYHRIDRGGFSPTRSFRAPGRPKDPDARKTSWYDRLNGGYKIRVWEGYGNAMEPTFVGLIDDCDTHDVPDEITLTCRNFGCLLTDQRLFGWNKAREVHSPIVFADRRRAEAGKYKYHKDWILVDDASDVIKWILMWAGFQEWVVAPTTVRLKDPVTFHQGSYMVEPIQKLIEQVDFVFYIDQPTDKPGSLGVPHFVPNGATRPPTNRIQQVTDQDLLTGVETKFAKEALAYIIRVRGKGVKGGVVLGEDRTKRFQATYRPPWSLIHTGIGPADEEIGSRRLAGLRKHETHVDAGLESNDECMMMAILIALQEALAAYTGSITVPGYPGFAFNEQVSIIDTPSGVNTRMWISQLSSTHTTGEQAAWSTTVNGAMLDTPDLTEVMADYRRVLKLVQSRYAA